VDSISNDFCSCKSALLNGIRLAQSLFPSLRTLSTKIILYLILNLVSSGKIDTFISDRGEAACTAPPFSVGLVGNFIIASTATFSLLFFYRPLMFLIAYIFIHAKIQWLNLVFCLYHFHRISLKRAPFLNGFNNFWLHLKKKNISAFKKDKKEKIYCTLIKSKIQTRNRQNICIQIHLNSLKLNSNF